MNYQMRKMACCYRLKKLANVAGLIQRSRLTKLAEGLVDPVGYRKFETALEQDFNDMDRRDGITIKRALDKLSGYLPNAQDGYTASPSEEYIAPMDPEYARFTLPKNRSEYKQMMSAEAQNVYGRKWSELDRSQREALRNQFYGQVGENYDNGNNAHAYVPKFMQKLYGFSPQYVGEPQLTQTSSATTSGVPSSNIPPLPESVPSEVDSVSALGTTGNPTTAQSAPKPAPASQQSHQRTQPRQQKYVFNGPIAQRIRARNGGPVFNGPVAQRMRARFGR